MRQLWPILIMLLAVPRPASAREGMFLLDKLPAESLKKAGLKIPPQDLRARSGAVVLVGSGGTGSFVSPRGLLVTNHHVAYRCIAALGARPEHLGLLERGHVARSEAEELSCPGYDLLVVVEVRDVKQEVLGAVKPRATWAQRFEAIRLKREELVEACEKDGRHVCEVAPLDGGASFTLSVYRRIRDVRLVYAPPEALGKFGGDIDNWMFPRHTADFTFLRAYVAPDGPAAPYAKGNVPLRTSQHLALSRDGLREGSFVAVEGFPARTSRHAASPAVRFYVEQQLPSVIDLLQGLVGVLTAQRGSSPDAKRKYAALDAGLQNALKYYEMSRRGFERYRTLERKLEAEKALRARLAGDAPRLKSMDDLLTRMGQVLGRYQRVFRRYALLSRLVGMGCPSLRVAHDLARWAREKQKPNRMRKEERYKDKNLFKIKEASERLDKEIGLPVEQALLLHLLREGEKLPAAERPRSTRALLRWARSAAKAKAGADPLSHAVELLFARTRLLAHSDKFGEGRSGATKADDVTLAARLRGELFDAEPAGVKAHPDPLIRYAREVETELHALREGPVKEKDEYLDALLQPGWVDEVLRPDYPDANFTIRLTFGSVRDYRSTETGKTHRYMSTVAELLAKDKGKTPFLVPPWLKAAFPSRLTSPFVDRASKDIPVNFTATVDTTGGNSGSPVLDDRGRLVGLLFDGTPESILSDWQFLQTEQRSICLDIRFALYLAGVQKNTRLLAELGLR
jgi:hypothetical protein